MPSVFAIWPVTGDIAVPSAPLNASDPAFSTPVVFEFFETRTDKIATPIIAMRIATTPDQRLLIFNSTFYMGPIAKGDGTI